MSRGADGGVGLLLVTLGFDNARRFAAALAPLGIAPRDFGVLRGLTTRDGPSQEELRTTLGLSATRMTFLVDDLETRGLIERRPHPDDRRKHALHITPAGRRVLEKATAVAARREGEVIAGLSRAERGELERLLRKIADRDGLPPGGMPGPG